MVDIKGDYIIIVNKNKNDCISIKTILQTYYFGVNLPNYQVN